MFPQFILFLCLKPICTQNLPIMEAKDDISATMIEMMHSYMNATVNPCTNIYEYACGNVSLASNHIPVSMENIYNDKITTILDGQGHNGGTLDDDDIYVRLRIYYESCKEQKSFDAAHYLDILKPMENEEWPRDNATWHPNSNWNIWSTLGKIASVGFNDWLFLFNRSRDCMSISPSVIRVQENAIFRDNIHAFIEKLHSLCVKYIREKSEPMTLSQLLKEIPNIDFSSYFPAIFGNITSKTMAIAILNVSYYHELDELVKQTSSDTLIHTIKLLFLNYLEHIKPINCVSSMRSVLPIAMNYIYDKYVYNGQKELNDAVVKKLFNNLKEHFFKILQGHSDDFSNAEINFLTKKILKMKLNIGNLPLGVDVIFYKEYYSNWTVVKGNFYQNHLNGLKQKTNEYLNMINIGPNSPKTSFENNIQAFYPFYLFSRNILVVPFDYLSYPAYQPQIHKLFLYADLGYSMSHAMMYAFSAFGLQYDFEGKKNTFFYESIKKKPIFLAAVNCLNASNSIELDIKRTDIIGFRLAYDSYFQQSKDLEYQSGSYLTNKQLFYLKFVQSECIVRKLPTYVKLSESIENIVRNSCEFEKVFGCDSTVEKCQLWLKCMK